jgi:hypothetical protein
VGSVNGDYTQTVAQKAVAGLCRRLSTVVAVTTQGGDGAGTARAFLDAGRTLPVVYMGNRYDELELWKNEHDKNGYQTESASIAPGVATFAFWYAQQPAGRREVAEGNQPADFGHHPEGPGSIDGEHAERRGVRPHVHPAGRSRLRPNSTRAVDSCDRVQRIGIAQSLFEGDEGFL